MPKPELKLNKLLGKPQRYLKYRPDNQWIMPGQYIGVEIELEKVGNVSLSKFIELRNPLWNVHQDPSLRDNGQEFTTSDGLFGEDLTEALNFFYGFLDGTKWAPSERTGIHIHLDVSDLELLNTFRTFVITYLIMEHPLFTFVGDDRRNNIFCLPWYKAQGNLDDLGALFNEDTTDAQFQDLVGRFDRYSAMNFASLPKYGTLEFRHLRTTRDKSKLTSWINLLMSMKKFSKETDMSPEEILVMAKNRPRSLAELVFGEQMLGKELVAVNSFQYECEYGIKTAEDVMTIFNPAISKLKEWNDEEFSLKNGLANRFYERQGNKKEIN